MDQLYAFLKNGIDNYNFSNDDDSQNNKIQFTKSCLMPVLRKSLEHAKEESEFHTRFFSPELNLIRCFLRLMFRNADSDEKRRIIQRFNQIFYWYFISLLKQYVSIVISFQNIKRALEEENKLHDTMFLKFTIRVGMMRSSLMYIQKEVDEILNVWDIGIPVEDLHFDYYYDLDFHPDRIVHQLLGENDLYGIIGIKQLLPTVSFENLLKKSKKSIATFQSWNLVTEDDETRLYHHDALPHPDHFLYISISELDKEEDSFASKAVFPFSIPDNVHLKMDTFFDSVVIVPERQTNIKTDASIQTATATATAADEFLHLENISVTWPDPLRTRHKKMKRQHDQGAKSRSERSRMFQKSKRDRRRPQFKIIFQNDDDDDSEYLSERSEETFSRTLDGPFPPRPPDWYVRGHALC